MAKQGSILGPLLSLLFTLEIFSILENKLISYADDSTLIAVVPSPGVRVTVAESMISDLGRVSVWCDLLGDDIECEYDQDYDSPKVSHNASQSLPLTIGGTVLTESDDLVILGVAFDSKMTFEKHPRSVSRAASQRLGILKKS